MDPSTGGCPDPEQCEPCDRTSPAAVKLIARGYRVQCTDRVVGCHVVSRGELTTVVGRGGAGTDMTVLVTCRSRVERHCDCCGVTALITAARLVVTAVVEADRRTNGPCLCLVMPIASAKTVVQHLNFVQT